MKIIIEMEINGDHHKTSVSNLTPLSEFALPSYGADLRRASELLRAFADGLLCNPFVTTPQKEI